MAVFKCKMCGGSLEVHSNMTVCECDYCGTQQTVPKNHSDAVTNQFNRANNLRLKCEFDKAQELYEKIVSENPDESEAYWGIILCHYGVEYVNDPVTSEKIPTCHRTQFEALKADLNYQSALEKASPEQKALYEKEASEIDELQKNILEIVRNEEPFDIFICYKETDENKKRTEDSVITNDIYHHLTQEGVKVFYAPITLEDKVGQEYEPYIFSALNSAKVLLAVGTKPEYFNAVWVKNEWNRFLKIMKNDRSKLLIPCYKGMDAYELPEEFSHFQAQDMSKIGFIQDLIRGIKKVVEKPVSNIPTEAGNKTANLLKRAFYYLEDKDWQSAENYCEKVLDIEPENAQAYFGKLMAQFKVCNEEQFTGMKRKLSDNQNYKKAYRFGDDALKNKLDTYNKYAIYNSASEQLMTVTTVEGTEYLYKQFSSIKDFKDSVRKLRDCTYKIERLKKDEENKRQEEQRMLEEKAKADAEQRIRDRKAEAFYRNIEILPVIASIAIVILYLVYIFIAKPSEKVEACDAETFSELFKFLFSMTLPVGITAFLIGIAGGIVVGTDVIEELGFRFWICAGSQIAIVLITMFSHGGGLVPVLMLLFALVRSLVGVVSFFISKVIASNIY